MGFRPASIGGPDATGRRIPREKNSLLRENNSRLSPKNSRLSRKQFPVKSEIFAFFGQKTISR
jgi:hypothetical protein